MANIDDYRLRVVRAGEPLSLDDWDPGAPPDWHGADAMTATAFPTGGPPPFDSIVFATDDLEGASLHPRCIVEHYLYANVGAVIAPGGVGKTTLMLYEAIRIALGGQLWGHEILNPGSTLFITAEDDRELFAARLRELMRAGGLDDAQREQVLASIAVWDLTGEDRRLVRAHDGNIVVTAMADEIVEAYKDATPAVIVIDPLVSFGASELAFNDNEQSLITAARRIVRKLGCAVRFVHHTGKANARERTTDQYSGRGGSALADGSRMVVVMARESDPELPPGAVIDPRASYTRLVRAKLSYCAEQPDLLIERRGWEFRHYVILPSDPIAARTARAEQLAHFIATELHAGQRHTSNTLVAQRAVVGMTRDEVREALAALESSGRIFYEKVSATGKRGGARTCINVSSLVRGA